MTDKIDRQSYVKYAATSLIIVGVGGTAYYLYSRLLRPEIAGTSATVKIVGGIETTTTILGTVEPEVQTRIIENITPKEAYDLIQENKDNPNFVVIDVRTPEEYAKARVLQQNRAYGMRAMKCAF